MLATGRYLGEGFDDSAPRHAVSRHANFMDRDTGAIRGRLHRDHDGKREVIVYDYVDRAVPVLARMAAKREKGYKALGDTSSNLDLGGGRSRPPMSTNSHAFLRVNLRVTFSDSRKLLYIQQA